MLTRRQFALGTSAFISPGFVRGARPAPSFHLPLPIPGLIDAATHGHEIRLRVAEGRHEFLKGKRARTYGYSAPILGPVLRLRRGDDVQMVVTNAFDRETTVHWHGLLLSGGADGGPQQIISPGATWAPVLTIDQPAATGWYHPHPHGDTAWQIYHGLSGMIMIEDTDSLALELPRTYGRDDLPIILQDRAIASNGMLAYTPSPLATTYGSRGDTIIVNGAIAPFASVPRGLVRMRLLNAANARNFDLSFDDGRKFHVIASDSGFLAKPVPQTRLTIAAAERYEILVDFADGRPATMQTDPDTEIGLFGQLTEHSAEGQGRPIMRFEPSSMPASVLKLPARLVEPIEAPVGEAAGRRRFVLDSGMAVGAGCGSGGGRMTINDKAYDMDRIDASVKLGTTEVWQVESKGMAHPFHVHGASFRILSLAGEPPPPHMSGWKDVVLIEDKAELLVAFNRPATSQHPFMFHCHILEHEEAGLMGQYVCA
jgi:FtsP/CotA-like multicopper oxidase with cupredoxin domain